MTSNDSRSRLCGRRTYLKGSITAIGSTLALAGITSAQQTEDEYGTVVDVVDAGADPNGNESVSAVLQDVIDDDTLLKFPEGRYYMDEQVRLTDFENVGLVGEDAMLVPANVHEFDGPQYRLFRLGTYANPGRDLRFEGFDVDMTAENTGIRAISAEVDDGLIAKDISIHGVHDSGTWGPGLFNITDPDGEGIVDCFRMYGGAVHPSNAPKNGRPASGILVNTHRGSLVFRNCGLGSFPGTGLYASGDGRIDVEGGWFANSDTASIRMGATRGRIEDAFFVVNENPDRPKLQHPIRLDYAERVEIDGVTIRETEPNGDAIRIKDEVDQASISNSDIRVGGGASSGIRIDSEAGPVSVENVDMEIDADGYAFRILGEDAGAVTLTDVEITGDADGSPVSPAIYCERNGCEFRRLSIDQPGDDNRRGIELRGDDALVADSEIEATHIPIGIIDADGIRVENTYANAYDDNYSVRITSGSGSVALEGNEFPDGVHDLR